MSLLEITAILTSHEISPASITYLESTIKNYLDMHLKLFPDRTLKPKHHFLLHYPNILRKTGSLCEISCIRFEPKHREFKKIASNVQSRKNIPLTLATKSQLKFACRCLTNVGLEDSVEMSKPIFEHNNFNNYDFHTNFNVDFYSQSCFEVKWYERNGHSL